MKRKNSKVLIWDFQHFSPFNYFIGSSFIQRNIFSPQTRLENFIEKLVEEFPREKDFKLSEFQFSQLVESATAVVAAGNWNIAKSAGNIIINHNFANVNNFHIINFAFCTTEMETMHQMLSAACSRKDSLPTTYSPQVRPKYGRSREITWHTAF